MILMAAGQRMPCPVMILPRLALLSSNILPRRGLGGAALPRRKIVVLGKEFLRMKAVRP
jgi:hypothetical protein